MKRKTIKNVLEFEGIGLHKGEKIQIKLLPNKEETGIFFQRVDLPEGKNLIKVDYKNLFDLERGTNIKNDYDARVYTIEHFMSALHVLGITDLIVEITGNELPILDGSTKIFLEEIEKIGLASLENEIEPIIIDQVVSFTEEKTGKHVVILPYNGFKVSYTIDFNHTFLKSEYYEIDLNLENYKREISMARTFAFDYEIEYLKNNNLALGGSLDNAIVIGKDGVLNPEGLRYENEFVRHKILDLIGDIYVLGRPIRGHIIAIKAGHFINAQLSTKLAEKYLSE
ncbi:MAG: UDP-3-O-[3-hydroxymyristoyl] N-acetylglucosamine deacetylase [Leptotrichiaceae bacterium]|nr:UDP-3-O-[3-hydroxymyristoyl] N-acetylglucosamine deacetylase [Leptotrichiaceae bacterium]MBP9876561.1 UDP-3-O-[3-hydroxymyristoyl] N-acetylglucosamine deacetylase [Leptotrichiaceae bacterium]